LSSSLGARLEARTANQIVAVSDFHIYHESFDFDSVEDLAKRERLQNIAQQNAFAAAEFTNYVRKQSAVSDIILNGDIFHGPSMQALSPEQKAQAMVKFLFDFQERTGKSLHFNPGNHDAHVVYTDGVGVPSPDFPGLLKKYFALELAERQKSGKAPKVALIGAEDSRFGDFKAIYDYEIGGKKFKIAHAPFAATEATVGHAESFRASNLRAFNKVALVDIIKDADGVYRIQSDSHTPQQDKALRVFNTGKLAVDETVPFPQKSFLLIDDEGGQLYELDLKGGARTFDPSRCDVLSRLKT
jgi:hypothetical protein